MFLYQVFSFTDALMVPKDSFKGYCFVLVPEHLLSSHMAEGSQPDTTVAVVLITNAHP